MVGLSFWFELLPNDKKEMLGGRGEHGVLYDFLSNVREGDLRVVGTG